MVKTVIGVEGMMCGMCEAHINDAVRAKFKVKSVKSSRVQKTTVIVSESELDETAVKSVIKATGYGVVSYSSEPYKKKKLFGN